MLDGIYKALVAVVLFALSITAGNLIQQPNTNNSQAAAIDSEIVTIFPSTTPIITIEPIVNETVTTFSADDNKPWGVSEKIGEHTYTIKLANDDRMGTPEEILDALNIYRQNHSSGPLSWDNTLADYANGRAQLFKSIKTTDAHAGLNDYLEHQNGFNKLGFNRIGENSYYGGPQHGVHMIEWVFSSSAEHDANQLNGSWSHVGIGVTDESVNLVFGGHKM